MTVIGIRREDKNRWEGRVPLIPADVAGLAREAGLSFVVQPSDIRVFSDGEYRGPGVQVDEDLSGCGVVLAVKEIPVEALRPERTYVFFSHTIKGQKQNMRMLRRLVELKCSVIDYELVTDDAGRRLIFFGRYAGLAGMIDTLWATGQRLLERDGLRTPFLEIRPAHAYSDLESAREAVRSAGEQIARVGLPEPVVPFVCGFAGYGNVSAGAQEIYDLLPVQEMEPEHLGEIGSRTGSGSAGDARTCFKVVFKEEHMVQAKDPSAPFDLQEYYTHPERYRGRFGPWLDHLSVLLNCVYWDERYPRLVTKKRLAGMFSGRQQPRLVLIGDIACDIEGSVEATMKATQPDDPVYVYDPRSGEIAMGFGGYGVAILAVDNLPCELSREASEYFSACLLPFVEALAQADLKSDAGTGLPPELDRALVLRQGKLEPRFRYMERFLSEAEGIDP